MSKDGSVAPKERVNIVYKSDTGGAQEEKELPFKQLVIGDFTLQESEVPLDKRKTIKVDKSNFNDVLKEQKLSVDINVANELVADDKKEEGEELAVHLDFQNLKDFSPDSIVEQVPELKQLIELRDALKSLKGPLGNMPEFRKKLQALVGEEGTRSQLLQELGLDDISTNDKEDNNNE